MNEEVKKFIKTELEIILCVLTGILGTIAVLFGLGIIWMFRTWSNLTLDQLIYQLNAPAEGADNSFFLSAVKSIVPGTVIFIGAFIAVSVILYKKEKKIFILTCIVLLASSIGLISSTFWYSWEKLEVEEYLEALKEAENDGNYVGQVSFIDKNYIPPGSVKITAPDEKRNLIFIVMESMEVTYTDVEDGGAFEEGCIPELTELAKENEDFSGSDDTLNGGMVMPYSTWTMGALFAHQSSLPLNIPIQGNNMSTQEDILLPRAQRKRMRMQASTKPGRQT